MHLRVQKVLCLGNVTKVEQSYRGLGINVDRMRSGMIERVSESFEEIKRNCVAQQAQTHRESKDMKGILTILFNKRVISW